MTGHDQREDYADPPVRHKPIAWGLYCITVFLLLMAVLVASAVAGILLFG
jgi:hypothetical protein